MGKEYQCAQYQNRWLDFGNTQLLTSFNESVYAVICSNQINPLNISLESESPMNNDTNNN